MSKLNNYLSLKKLDGKVLAVEAGPFQSEGWQMILNLGLVNLTKIFYITIYNSIKQEIIIKGDYSLDYKSCILVFEPYYSFLSTEIYKANLDIAFIHKPIHLLPIKSTLEFSNNSGETYSPTYVTSIYPTTRYWPKNILRFYIEFSDPMSEDQVLDHIHLVDEYDNKQIGVFLDTIRELWAPNKKLLTVLFDPGRVKMGLRAHSQLGRALKQGQEYHLVVEQNMLDFRGNKLRENYNKTFFVQDEILTQLDINSWKFILPNVNSFEPLKLIFPKPLDRSLLEVFIQVLKKIPS